MRRFKIQTGDMGPPLAGGRCLSYFTFSIKLFLRNPGMPLKYKQYCDWWEVNQSGTNFTIPTTSFSHVFCTNDVIFRTL